MKMARFRRIAIACSLVMFFWSVRCAHATNACPASVPTGITNCYYIDYSSGSDSNTGADELHPWKHLPGMTGNQNGTNSGDNCTANCAANTPVAGNGYILKGGVTWPYTVFPLNWTWSGTGSATSPGCTGPGCIYIGIDQNWFSGVVNAVIPSRDYGGCPATGVTASISGGGGTGAAATPVMLGGQANFDVGGYLVAYYTLTSAGSGYTSNPTVTVTGTGCNNIQAVADIHRAVFDLGGAAFTWTPSQSQLDTVGVVAFNRSSNLIVDNLDIRNFAFNNSGGAQVPIFVQATEAPGVTFQNLYVHNWYTTQARATSGSDGSLGLSLGYNSTVASGLAQNNWVGNGEAAYTCTVSGGASQTVCGYGTLMNVNAGIGNPGEVLNNHLWFGNWMVRACPGLVSGNDIWGTIVSDNGGHTNNFYTGLCGTGSWTETIANNLLHDTDAGAMSFLEQGNGNTWYVYNNVTWKAYGGSTVWAIDESFGAGPATTEIYLWNNTMYAENGTNTCVNVGASQGTAPYAVDLNVWLNNNQCITDQTANPWFSLNTGTHAVMPNTVNGVSNPSVTTPNSANVVMTPATASSQGYTIANALQPMYGNSGTATFQGANLTVTIPGCGTAGLGSLCADILGVSRLTTGAWQAGAYQYTGTILSGPASPINLGSSAK